MKPQVLILAAGRGSRLAALTDERPKTLVEFAGKPILEWQLAALAASDYRDITIATGYRCELLEAYGFPTVHNAQWATTNMVSTLLCATDLLHSDGDLIVSYSDIVYEPRVLDAIAKANGDIATVIDLNWLDLWSIRSDDPLSDAETLRLDAQGRITEIGQKPQSLAEVEGQYIGLTKLTRAGKRAVLDLVSLAGTDRWPYAKPLEKVHFTDLLRGLIGLGYAVKSAPTRGGWLEIDTPEDVKAYERCMSEGNFDRFYVPVKSSVR